MAAASDAFPGAELGDRFADVQLLHAGSRFVIFEARDRSSERPVVVKLPERATGEWLHDVLRTEAAILAAVGSHPHVITLFQHLVLDDRRPALVLERCRGTVLQGQLDDDVLPLQDAVATGIKLAGALETVHRAGWLHCDVRPQNVLVTEWGEPVLSGFDEAVRADAALVRPPMHQLTAHTAPELLEGNEPTRASDVYGLASTLYELVAGRAAFRAYVGESPASVVVRVLSSNVKPIVGPHVPLEVSDLLTWAMAPSPSDRPPSPAWLAEELGRIQARQGWPRTHMIAG